MDTALKWRFVSNNGGIYDGFNDSGIETFSANSIASMVREVIQNSIDQQVDLDSPVRVEFEFFKINKEDFPGSQQLKEIFRACIQATEKDENTHGFFDQAINLMNESIDVLRISDFNTTGLIGADTGEKDSPWYNLVKGRGTSNKNFNSGGSFGIGKSAPLACSYFRTIFYASKVNNIDSYIGVSRLLSHNEKDEDGNEYVTVGTGFYSDKDNLNAVLNPFSLGDFKRVENGTDIYIMALEKCNDIYKIITQSVLENFFFSIELNKLEVKIGNEIISKENIALFMDQLDEKKYKEIKEYYNLIIGRYSDDENYKKFELDSKEYGDKYKFSDGECTLYLRADTDLNRKILMTRKTGMTLFSQGYISQSISFTGVLFIHGDMMNRVFKTMEMPSHDSWQPGRCKVDKTFYENAYKDLKKYLRDKVRESFEIKELTNEVAVGMDEFFSNLDSDDSVNLDVSERKPKIKCTKQKRKTKSRSLDSNGTEDILGAERIKSNQEQKNRANRVEVGNGDDKEFKKREVKKNLIAQNMYAGEYSLTFTTPSNKKCVKLEFIGIGEKGQCAIPLEKAILVGVDEELVVEKNVVYLKNVEKGQDIHIDFTLLFGGPIMMEVNYYEAK